MTACQPSGNGHSTEVVLDAEVDVLMQSVGEHDTEDRGPLRVDGDMTQVDALRFKHGERLRAVAVGSELSKRRDVEVEASRGDEDVAGAAGLEKVLPPPNRACWAASGSRSTGTIRSATRSPRTTRSWPTERFLTLPLESVAMFAPRAVDER